MRGNPSAQLLYQIACRFIANLPKEQLIEQRIGFHFEKAYFYYLDVQGLPPQTFNKNKNEKYRQPKQIVSFCNQLLRIVSCPQLPRLTGNQISLLIEENYCTIPVHGIIILNFQQTHVVLVQSLDNQKFGFPKGKINEGQASHDCAIRQVKQQIGLNIPIDQNYYVEVEIFSKLNGKSASKICRFFICKVQESCIVPRKSEPTSLRPFQSNRMILHSASQISSINWYKIQGQIPKLIDKDLLNAPSKLAFFELVKKISKNLNYKQKRVSNPLQEFKCFDKQLGQIFLKQLKSGKSED